MSERPGPAAGADLPLHLLDTGAPVALTRTSFSVAAATVTGPCGTALLTVTLQRARPEAPAEDDDTDAMLVGAAGAVDMYTAPLLEAALNDAVDRHPIVRCDLSDVRLLCAAGITALLNARDRPD